MDLKETFFGAGNTNKIKDFATEQGFTDYIGAILPNVYIIAGFILFIYFVAGGFMLISSAGDAKKADEGKQALTNAAVGFIVIFASYWIIQIIEIITGVPIVKGN